MNETFKVKVGDCRSLLRSMEPESVNCVVTSPPYLGLRKYDAGSHEIGREETLDDYIRDLVEVFVEVRRVLRKDGVAWLNIGDGFVHNGPGNPEFIAPEYQRKGRTETYKAYGGRIKTGIAPKNLMLVPQRVAIAMQDDGWCIRQCIIWHKPNPMPESVKDRPTNAHEHIWMMTRSARYWYDQEAVGTPYAPSTLGRIKNAEKFLASGRQGKPHKYTADPGETSSWRFKNGRDHQKMQFNQGNKDWSNLQNVWNITTKASKENHYATFPEELPTLCILASCPPGGVVLDPFGGSGTTGKVAVELGRKAILIELNQEYAEIARKRCAAAKPSLL